MEDVKIGGIYRHYKGDYYLVENICLHSETLEKMVIYRALYEDGLLWCRLLRMFVEEVEGKDQKHRFELQKITSLKNKSHFLAGTASLSSGIKLQVAKKNER